MEPTINRDLETITLKCLHKDAGRGESVRRQRWRTTLPTSLHGEPIHARPVTRLEHTRKWVARNPAVAALSAAAVLLLVLGSVVSAWFAVDAHRKAGDALTQKGRADNARAAQHRLARNCVLNGNRLLEAQDWAGTASGTSRTVRSKPTPSTPTSTAGASARRSDVSRRCTAVAPARRRTVPRWNGEYLVSIDGEGVAHFRDARTGERRGQPLRLDAPIRLVALSDDGRRVVTVAGQRGERQNQEPSSARLWDVPDGRPPAP